SHVENKGNARIRFRTDDVWLRQILSCLILNGAQAVGSASANGWVQVNYSSEKDWVHISVSDNGGGLKQAAELGKTTKSDGLGIGLMLADTLTSNLGGTLSLVNGPVGLMAIVKLPLNQGET
ncbi:MAG: ATP-binding protein, partial [Myxococcota bacterium]|nr:ATP-binding protein [Myxococcota bacterium]